MDGEHNGLVAKELAAKGLVGFQKVAILGCSGWFGREALELCLESGNKVEVLGFASKATSMTVESHQLELTELSLGALMKFQPELIIDAAFLTREHARTVGLENYERINRKILDITIAAAQLPSVRKFIGFSSGVVVPEFENENLYDDGGLYAKLKRNYEYELERVSLNLDKEITVLRTFSVSGSFNNRPQLFAFSSLVLEALQGEMVIRSKSRVLRRYSDVGDLIAMALGLKGHRYKVIESGGDLVEIGDLANKIRDLINPSATISRLNGTSQPSLYASNGTSWERCLEVSGLRAKTLIQQIESTRLSVESNKKS